MSHPGDVSPMSAWRLTRRGLEIVLGLVWLADGALQFQPYTFSQAFFLNMLGMGPMGLSKPVSTVDYQVTVLLAAHRVVWNAVFASLQVALGVGLLWRRTSMHARAVSIAWAVGLWVIGEGFGGMFMGGSSLLIGAPGAALVDAVIAVVLWPAAAETGRRWRMGGFSVGGRPV